MGICNDLNTSEIPNGSILSEDRDQYITWWINYFSLAIGQKITWKYMPFRSNLNTHSSSHGLAYTDRGYITFNPLVIQDYWKNGNLVEIRGLIAHEVQHFNQPDGEHHGKNFKSGMVRWTGLKR